MGCQKKHVTRGARPRGGEWGSKLKIFKASTVTLGLNFLFFARSHDWEGNLLDLVLSRDFKEIRVSIFTSRSLSDEVQKKMDSSLPFIPLTGFVMVTVCMGLLWTKDCVRLVELCPLFYTISLYFLP